MNGYCLITGGTGYIGSHITVEMLNTGYNVIILDNLSNSKIDVIDKIKVITGKDIIFYENNINNISILQEIFTKYHVEFVIHCAGFKSVRESISEPLNYYENNLYGSLCLLNVMKNYDCKKLIFSSSATVYGTQDYPVDENCQTGIGITNAYGRSKYMIEEILKDLYKSDNTWSIVILRYFNPIGSHPSGLIGDNPITPNNLFPYILKTSVNMYNEVQIFGNDYNTIDGTGARDYIDICDLATAHVASIIKLNINNLHIYNIGRGKPITVLELLRIFEKTNNIQISYKFAEKRIGDLDIIYAKVDKVKKELGWEAKCPIEDTCRYGYKFIKYVSY